ncbi:uncharacterized protein [Cicer arietinum]|uniref:Uncharacterized protein LOC101493999 n=1 Tax=Cicer arietinum TaxID=3827 RepID=A0A1S2YS42_CICAR|nr:uncharacterized protein LOC101493999 [Cicer arietinum]
MPTKQVSYRNDKEVLVKVYVEKGREKRLSSIQQHHHHYHIYHHKVTQEVVDGSTSSSSNKGYDRRSSLLMYSRHLRNSARGGASSMPLLPKYSTNNNLQSSTKMNSFEKKQKHGGTPVCFGNWKLVIPSILRSWSNDQKKEKKKKQVNSGNGFKKLQVVRGKGFIQKIFSTTCKCA